jgi:hypothetical protein
MHTITGDKKHLFPHRDDRSKPMVTASLRQMLKVIGWSGKLRPHATRTTGSTRLNESGYAPNWIERQLAHEEGDAARRAYNRADYFTRRTEMMQEWANMFDKLKAESKTRSYVSQLESTWARVRGGSPPCLSFKLIGALKKIFETVTDQIVAQTLRDPDWINSIYSTKALLPSDATGVDDIDAGENVSSIELSLLAIRDHTSGLKLTCLVGNLKEFVAFCKLIDGKKMAVGIFPG